MKNYSSLHKIMIIINLEQLNRLIYLFSKFKLDYIYKLYFYLLKSNTIYKYNLKEINKCICLFKSKQSTLGVQLIETRKFFCKVDFNFERLVEFYHLWY